MFHSSSPAASLKYHTEMSVSFSPVIMVHPNMDLDKETFHYEMSPVLSVAQLFGILPIRGIRAEKPQGLRLERKSFLWWYTIGLMAASAFLAIISLLHTFISVATESYKGQGGIGAVTAGTVFYCNATAATYIFWRLAAKWRPLMVQWATVEHRLSASAKPLPDGRRNTLAVFITVFFFAIVEHCLSTASHSSDDTWAVWLEKYSMSSHAFIFSVVPYSVWLALLIQVISRVATFVWNFTDVFIMLVGRALTARFEQFNSFLLRQPMRSEEWREAREQYVDLSKITKKVDSELSALVFLSFANNLYFICLQLLNGMTPYDGEKLLQWLYFWLSFLFLVFRTAAVTIFLSNVHVASRESLPLLYSCPNQSFCKDTERLLQHMSSDDLAISGLGLYQVTRSFLLAVAGAIVTYEMVLLQFNTVNAQKPHLLQPGDNNTRDSV